jgi:hypothetical protein
MHGAVHNLDSNLEMVWCLAQGENFTYIISPRSNHTSCSLL